jgi:hypothetical protein
MFKRLTVFVVGAGASAEVQFPVGTELARTIGRKMDIRFERGYEPVGSGDFELYSHIRDSHRQEGNKFQHAAWRIRDGIAFAQSIDDFLDQHRTDKYVNLYGKAAIVHAVVEAERNSSLYFNRAQGAETFDDQKILHTWFVKFMSMLCRGVPRENVNEIFDNVSFIVFNYDRCIEHFLIHALQRAYAIPLDQAISIVEHLDIFHPYGVVGDLRPVPFGTTRINVLELAEGIKTYTEQIAAADVKNRAMSMLANAENIVFLGFAYHDQNMTLIAPDTQFRTSKRIFGTAFGMSDSGVEDVTQLIDGWFVDASGRIHAGAKIKLENKLKCADLFDYYAKSLTA